MPKVAIVGIISLNQGRNSSAYDSDTGMIAGQAVKLSKPSTSTFCIGTSYSSTQTVAANCKITGVTTYCKAGCDKNTGKCKIVPIPIKTTTTQFITCWESDGGLIPTSAGDCTSNGRTVYDHCGSNIYLHEYYCGDLYGGKSCIEGSVYCGQYGKTCLNGACV